MEKTKIKTMLIYVYKIYFPTSKRCYIGQTENLNKRMQSHLRANTLIKKALWKYDDWQISILHIAKSRNEANRTEIKEIRNFNSIAPNGYNLTRSGDGGAPFTGCYHTEITKKKMSKDRIGNKSGLGCKRPDANKRFKENNPNKNGAIWKGRRNPNAHSIIAKIKRLKTRIRKLDG